MDPLIDLKCDNCQLPYPVIFMDSELLFMQQHAAKHGWMLMGNDTGIWLCLCPDCLAAHVEEISKNYDYTQEEVKRAIKEVMQDDSPSPR